MCFTVCLNTIMLKNKIDAAAYFLVPTVYRSTRGLNHISCKQQQRVFCFDEVY